MSEEGVEEMEGVERVEGSNGKGSNAGTYGRGDMGGQRDGMLLGLVNGERQKSGIGT